MKIRKRARREAKRLFRLCQVNGVLDETRVRQVVRQVAEAGHRDSTAILSHMARLVRLHLARHAATIESAIPLPAGLQSTIEGDLKRRYGPELATAFGHRPELIGGMRIQVGHDVYDGSVQAALLALEQEFVR